MFSKKLPLVIGFVFAFLFIGLSVDAQTTSLSLTRNLSFGSSGTDVSSLQQFLISQGHLSSGNATGYFGPLTQAAVQSFQRAQGIVTTGTVQTTGYGLVGIRTRAALATFTGAQGTFTQNATIGTTFNTAVSTTLPPTVDLKVNGSDGPVLLPPSISIQAHQQANLSWSSTNATSCTASGGWSGTQKTSGSQSFKPTVNTLYIITCTGSGGSASDEVTVNKIGAPSSSMFNLGEDVETIYSSGNIFNYPAPDPRGGQSMFGGVKGRVVGGPAAGTCCGHIFWHVDYVNGMKGWTEKDNLKKAIINSTYTLSNMGDVIVTKTNFTQAKIVTFTMTAISGKPVVSAVISSSLPSGVTVSPDHYNSGSHNACGADPSAADPTCSHKPVFSIASNAATGVFPVTLTTYGPSAPTETSTFNLHILPAGTAVPTVSLKANNTPGTLSITNGTQISLTWDSTNVTSCDLSGDGWSGTKYAAKMPSPGFSAIPLSNKTTTYIIICSDVAGQKSAPSTVVVTTTAGSQTNKFNQNDKVETNADAVNVRSTPNGNPPIDSKSKGAKGVIMWDATTSAGGHNWWEINYDTGKDGWTAEQYLNLILSTATPPPPPGTPTVELKANNTLGSLSVTNGTQISLTWVSTDATGCALSANSWSSTNFSAQMGSPGFTTTPLSNTTTTYTITCYDANGVKSAPSTVVVTTTGSSNTFKDGDTVEVTNTTTSVNVRSSANGTVIGTQPLGALGLIKGTSINSGGYDWWNVDYVHAPDGWTAEQFLQKNAGGIPSSSRVSLQATPNSVAVNTPVLLIWALSNWPTSSPTTTCNATGGTAGWPGTKYGFMTGGQAVVTPTTAGTHTFNIDCSGYKDSVTVTVTTAGSTNKPPVANAGQDKTITLPTSSVSVVSPPVDATDPDGSSDINTHTWSFVSGPAGVTPGIAAPGNKNSTFSGLTVAGTYTFRFTVEDKGGLRATDDMNVVVLTSGTQSSGPVVDLKANGSNGPVTLSKGDSVQFSWTGSNLVNSCSIKDENNSTISGGTGLNPLGGTLTLVNLTSTHTYTITCFTSNNSTATDSVTVIISGVFTTPVVDLKANGSDNPITLTANQDLTLSWTIQGVLPTCSLRGWGVSGSNSSGYVELSSKVLIGSAFTITPTTAGYPTAAGNMYEINCTVSGAVTKYDRVIVTAAAVTPPGGGTTASPVVTLSASSGSVADGQSVALTLTSQNATYCTGNVFSDNRTSGTAYVVPPFGGNTSVGYSVICYNGLGGPSKTASVNVTKSTSGGSPSSGAPTLDFKADNSKGPLSVGTSGSVYLSWSTTNVSSCTLSNAGISYVSLPSGFWNATPSSYTSKVIYTMSCTGTNGASISESITVYPVYTTVSVNSSYPLPKTTYTLHNSQDLNLAWSAPNLPADAHCDLTSPVSLTNPAGQKTGSWKFTSTSTNYPPNNVSSWYSPGIVYTVTCSNSGGIVGMATANILLDPNTTSLNSSSSNQLAAIFSAIQNILAELSLSAR
jgi:hypothetical protein